MNFLFHTIILFDDIRVYYNIYKDNEIYFAEVLGNPNNVITATNFTLQCKKERWNCSIGLSENQIQALIQLILQCPKSQT